MKSLAALFLVFSLLLPALAAENEKEEDRVKNSGEVLKEILNIPDDIPQDLLDKAECLIILPSVKLGADASAAAGPKGRTAEGATDVVMSAEILSYSRSKGLFAGISLEGSTLRSDGSANEKLYGRKLTAKEIIREGKVGVPAAARELDSLLNKKSPKNRSEPKSLQ